MHWVKSEGRRLVGFDLGGAQEGIPLVEVELVKADRFKKEKQQMSLFEKFVTEGNGEKKKQDELAKDGAMLDVGEGPATTERFSRHCFHCLVEECTISKSSSRNQKQSCFLWTKKVEAKSHRTEWCAAANKYRCMKYGRSSKKMKMQGTCEGPRWLGNNSNHKLNGKGTAHLGDTTWCEDRLQMAMLKCGAESVRVARGVVWKRS